jgi:hypothetical protein
VVIGWQLCNWRLIPSGVRNPLHQNGQNDYKEHVTSCPVGTTGYPNEGKKHEQKPNHLTSTKLSRSKAISISTPQHVLMAQGHTISILQYWVVREEGSKIIGLPICQIYSLVNTQAFWDSVPRQIITIYQLTPCYIPEDFNCHYYHCQNLTYEDSSFNFRTDSFSGRLLYAAKWQQAGQVATLCKCTCITGSRYLPAFTLWKPLSERLPAVCITSHDGGESSAVCVHKFLFPSGENWCWNVRNAASSFQGVLPKSIEHIWVVFPFQKWMPILWRWALPRQTVHLPHRGEHGTCARNHSCRLMSDYQRGCRGCWNSIRYIIIIIIIIIIFINCNWVVTQWQCQKILSEELQMRLVSVKFVPCLLMAEQKDDRV